jgi:hypothetical protein
MATPTAIPCERPWCPNDATVIASRVDARRDHWYLCDDHRMDHEPVYEHSPLPPRAVELPTGRGPYMSVEFCLAVWSPRHRTKTREVARAMVDAPSPYDT